MEAKVLKLIKELGLNIVSTCPVYGVEDASVQAESGDLVIRTLVTSKGLDVMIRSGDRRGGSFHFEKGKAPYLLLKHNTPELRELARRFGAIADFEI